jgi:hypothetical protein
LLNPTAALPKCRQAVIFTLRHTTGVHHLLKATANLCIEVMAAMQLP